MYNVQWSVIKPCINPAQKRRISIITIIIIIIVFILQNNIMFNKYLVRAVRSTRTVVTTENWLMAT